MANVRSGWPRHLRIVTFALLVPLLLILTLWRFALFTLERQVRAALGPDAQFASLAIGWPGVVVIGQVRLPAPAGWPAADTLRAERIEVIPDLRSLLTQRIVVHKIAVEGAYMSLRRNRAGQLELLPSLMARAAASPVNEHPSLALSIAAIELSDASLDFFDASIRRTPVHLHLDGITASLQDLVLPQLSARSALELSGTIRGAQRNGRITVQGWMQIATRESDLNIALDDVDLVTLEPYLITAAETGVKRGGLNLQLHSQIHQRQLKAPGTLVLTDLELKSGGGLSGTFMGMPRKAVIGALKSGSKQISLRFSLDGNLDNPRFSLNEALSVRVAVGMAQSLGVGLADIARDVGTFGGRTLEATGNAIGKLFGRADGAAEAK